MRRLPRLLLILALAVAARAQPAPKANDIFDFRSGFWLNLHQFLWAEAASAAPKSGDSPEWQKALDYYRLEVVAQDSLSPRMADLNNRLSQAGSGADLADSGVDSQIATVLTEVAPIYRRRWWLGHDRLNRAWMDAVRPLLVKYGARMKKDIAAAYQTDWPAAPVRTDVSAYAGPYGAYTTAEPVGHITISSSDPGYRGLAALEMLFHEASHTLDEKVSAALRAEATAQGMLFRRRGFDHAIVFYTAGEITRRYIAGYETYGQLHGMWTDGWPGSLPVLEKDWKPYLDGQATLGAAVAAMVRDYGVPKAGK